ncbi:MAG: protein kinase, partial [Cyanobacteria bacterium P01_A01_bin.105]
MNGADLGTPPLGSRYQLLKALSGSDQTYLAEDLHRFRELCVLKEFVPQVSDPSLLVKANELFEREAGVLYRLQHPQIPRFRELLRVEGESPRLFLVQDYVEGPTYRTLLTNRLGQGSQFTELEITQLLHQLLPVLDYLHNVGVIHRDISPENLILRNTDGLPVLIDFGSVKQIEANVRQQLQASEAPDKLLNEPKDRTRIGKVGYAPPEQARTGAVDPTSDLYSLGATALTLATGQEPDQFYDPQQQRWDWSEAVTFGPVLTAVLTRLLAPTPAERFPSAAAAMAALQTTGGVAAAPASPNGVAAAPGAGAFYPPEPNSSPDNAPEPHPATVAAVVEPEATPVTAGATVAVAPQAQGPPPTVAVAARPAESSIPGIWQALVGLLVLLGLAGLLGLLLVGRPGLLRLPTWNG